jgi:histone H3/H4
MTPDAETPAAPTPVATVRYAAPNPQAAPRAEEPARRLARPAEEAKEPEEVLVVASRLKQYIKDKADMNTSADVLEALSDLIRSATDDAIRNARAEGRKTVMARDYR